MTDATDLARRWLAALPTDPSIHLHRFDLTERTAVLARLDESQVRDAAYLDDRALRADTEAVVVPIEVAIEAIGAIAPRPHDAIFHVDGTDATLVSRMLGALPRNLPKREPLPWLACGVHSRTFGTDLTPRAFAALFEATSRALARTADPEQRALIKSSSIASSLLPFLIRREPSQRAIALLAPLERWLAGALEDEHIRDGVAHYASWWKGDLVSLFPEAGLEDHLFTPGELLAMAWCGPLCWFDDAHTHHPERIIICDTDQLLDSPAVGLAALSSFLELGADTASIVSAVKGADAARAERDAKRARGRERHAEEIGAGMRFAERFARIGLIADKLSG